MAELGFEPLSGDPGSAPFDPLHQGPANFFHKGPGSKSVLGSVGQAVSVAAAPGIRCSTIAAVDKTPSSGRGRVPHDFICGR